MTIRKLILTIILIINSYIAYGAMVGSDFPSPITSGNTITAQGLIDNLNYVVTQVPVPVSPIKPIVFTYVYPNEIDQMKMTSPFSFKVQNFNFTPANAATFTPESLTLSIYDPDSALTAAGCINLGGYVAGMMNDECHVSDPNICLNAGYYSIQNMNAVSPTNATQSNGYPYCRIGVTNSLVAHGVIGYYDKSAPMIVANKFRVDSSISQLIKKCTKNGYPILSISSLSLNDIIVCDPGR